eukprot:Skav234058  [mRNA]  locus=scaffold619:203009:207535:+ [translate_table: standard]
MLKIMPPMPPPAAANSVVAEVCATTRSAPNVVAKVDAGLKAKKPTSSRKVPKRSCTGCRHLRNGMKTFFSAGSWGSR